MRRWLELVISDDVSGDGTWQAMQRAVAGYAGPHRVRLNRNPVSLGIGAHLSRLVELSAGELLFVAAGMKDVYRAVDCTVMASRFEPFGPVGVESALCGTPMIGAHDIMGVMEVLHGDAALPFRLDETGSLEAAVAVVLQRWRAGRLALAEPRRALAYDPSVDAHLDALLGWVERLSAGA